jgi:CRP-like cAMP-binding protein
MLTNHRTDRKIERIGALRAFRGCSPRQLAQIASLAAEVELERGAVLCAQGGVGREAFIILEGAADVHVGDRVVASVGPGDVVGEMAVLDRGPRSATVTATTPLSALVFTAGELSNLIEDVPPAARHLLVSVSRRLRTADETAGPS